MTHVPNHSPSASGSWSRMGVNFPLEAFERRIADDPDVLGMLYAGSLGRGEADRCSDIDVTLWVRDEVLDTPRLLEHYMGLLGELHFVFSLGRYGNGYAGPDWQSIDVELMGKTDFGGGGSYYHRATVVKDTDGFLASIVAASPPPTPEVTLENARKAIEEAIHILGHLTMHNIRGSACYAMGQLDEQAGNLYGLLARLRGREQYDVRFVERFLPSEELTLLYAAWPARPEREEIRSAARGLWQWTRYVWAEAEATFGESLGISLDVEAFLPALERPYSWET
jgi:hypothetical protein